VIERLTRVQHHPAHVWALLHIGWAGACSVPSAAPPNATKRRSTAGLRSAGRRFCKRPTAQSLSGLLRRERAQPDPNVRRTWAPRGLPPTLTHPFNWKKALDIGRALYGVRGGGAQLAFHVMAGNYNTDTLIQVLWRAAPLPGRGEGDPAVGRPARPPQPSDASLAGDPAALAGDSACPPTPPSSTWSRGCGPALI
jgi:hypothetical protein